MSNFGEPFRSQVWASGRMERAGQQQFEASRYAADTAQNAVRSMQDLALRKQEMDLRMQEWEMQRQIQQRKLQELMSVDLAEQSRLQNEALKVGIEQQRAQTAQMQYQTERLQRQDTAISPAMMRMQQFEGVLQSMFRDPLGAAQAGFYWDSDKGQPGVYERGTKEYEENVQRAQETEKSRYNWRDVREEGLTLRELLKSTESQLDSLTNELTTTEESRKKNSKLIDDLTKLRDQLRARAAASVGISINGEEDGEPIDLETAILDLARRLEAGGK